MSELPYVSASVPRLASDAPASVSSWRDWVGIVASVGCAIHCAAMPFVIAFLPTLGLSFLADESFHQWMALACFVIAIVAFVPGWRKHRRLIPIVVASSGLILITGAAFGLTGDCCATCNASVLSVTEAATCTDICCEHCAATEQTSISLTARQSELTGVQAFIAPFAFWITPLGGMLLVSAHLLNRRYGCLRGCCPVGDMVGRAGGHPQTDC